MSSITNSISEAQENIYDFNHSLSYTRHLIKSGQYDQAIDELERIIFMKPGNDSLKLMLLESYYFSKDYKGGINRSEDFFPIKSIMPERFAYLYSKSLILDKDFLKFRSYVDSINTLSEGKIKFLLLNSYLFEKKWHDSQLGWKQDSALSQLYPEYINLMAKLPSFQYKNPAAAATLSAFLPGAGKWYTHNTMDGILSLVTTGALTFQAYRGFSLKGINSTYGWIFGTLAFGFYSGNIYGSYKAAKKFNSVLDEKFLTDVFREFDSH